MSGDGLVRVVVDDSACLVPEVARNLDITVVPINHDIAEDEATTSAVSPLQLCAAYARALERSSKDGSDAGVVAIHLSKHMSATWANAVTATGVLDRVTVIDTDTVGAGLGAAAIAAAKAARAGATRDEVAEVARDVLNRYRFWLFVPKLESLRRGGRIPTGQAFFSTALAMKPIISIKEGALSLVAKCRTEAKVKQRMVEFAAKMVQSASSESRPPAVLLHHADARDDVEELQSMLADVLPDDTRFKILDIPESLSIHLGQGAYAVGVVSGDAVDNDIVDFHVELGVKQLLAESPETAELAGLSGDDADDETADTPAADGEGVDGEVAAGETVTDQAAAVTPEPSRTPQVQRTVVTNEQGTPLFTTVVSKLPTWSENRQAAMKKANQLAKAISDLALRDKSDPEGAAFGESEAGKGESSSSVDGDEEKK